MTMKERLLILALIFQGCATHFPVEKLSGEVPILIDTKAQIKDLRKDDSHGAKIEIILVTQKAIRMEVTALFGYPIASIVMTPKNIQYALHTSKQYVEGPFSTKTMYPVFKQNIDPRILWNVIHNQNPDSADLKCVIDNLRRPIKCVGSGALLVEWSYDPSDSNQKRIEIKNPQFQMIWVFKGRSIASSAQNETFVLKKPDGYTQIQLK